MKLEENINGTGPFIVKEHQKDVVLRYERNPDYFKDPYPYFDGMDYFMIIDPGATITAFETQRVIYHPHINSGMTSRQRRQLEKDMVGKGHMVLEGPLFNLWAVPNMRRPPLDDIRARTAFHLVHSRQDVIKAFREGSLMGGLFPPGFSFSQTEDEILQLPGYRVTATGEKDPRDIAEAKRLWAEYEADKGEVSEIDFITIELGEFPETSQLYAAELEKHLGVKSNIRVIQLAVYLEESIAGNYDLFEAGHSHSIMEPDDIIAGGYVEGGRSNFNNLDDPRINDLNRRQQRETDPEKRDQILLEMADVVMEILPFIYHTWAMELKYVDDRIKNYRPGASDAQHGKQEHLWCDPQCG
jgi:ABC-type transport system substrate-binding protein